MLDWPDRGWVRIRWSCRRFGHRNRHRSLSFLQVVDGEIDAHNERPGRRARTCAGRSFWETFKESYERGPVRKATAEQLALALMAVEGVKVSGRDGTFRLAGDNRYFSAAVGQLRRSDDLLYVSIRKTQSGRFLLSPHG